jgi:hypothetical protein
VNVYFSVDKRAFDGELQLSIQSDEGHGYRIAGPKYDGNGKTLLRRTLTERDRDEIMRYLAKIGSDNIATEDKAK